MAGAALSQSQEQISWQAQRFRGVVAGASFARSGANLVAGAAHSQGQVQILWQEQRFREAKCKFHGRRSTFARSGKGSVARAALAQVRQRNVESGRVY